MLQVGAPQTASTDSLRFIDLVQKIVSLGACLFNCMRRIHCLKQTDRRTDRQTDGLTD